MADLIIRKSLITDARAVSDLYLESRREFLPYAPMAHTEEDIHKWIENHLIPTGNVSVAVLHNTIVGMMALSDDGAFCWIDHLYLKPNYTNQGYGSLLMKQALQELNHPIRLYTFQANESARRFYERFGFMPIEFGDGSGNEEKCPDVLYELKN